MHGGGHERGMRSGTLPTHQIVGMGEAFRIAKAEMATENERIRMLRDRLWKGLARFDEVYVNGNMEQRVPHNLNASFNFVEGESLIMAIKDIAVSSGSACTSASLEPSYVLRALGRSDELAHSSIRFTIGRFTTEDEVDYTIDLLQAQGRKAARTVPALGNVPGRCRPEQDRVGRALGEEHTWHTAKKLSTTTKIRATSARCRRMPRRRHRHGRRAGLRRRDEAADQGRTGRHHRGCEVQDLRLRLGDRVVVAGHRMGEGQDAGSGDERSRIRRSPRSWRCRR